MYDAFDENLHSHGSSVCICPDCSIEICKFDATLKTIFSKKVAVKIGAFYDETCTLICTLIYLYFSFSAMNEKTKTNLTSFILKVGTKPNFKIFIEKNSSNYFSKYVDIWLLS
jgi:hypothetical protein